jgi:rubredoxin
MRTRETCPLCGTTAESAERFITTVKGYDLWRCPECGLVYGRDILDEDDIFGVYDEQYVGHYSDPALTEQMHAAPARFLLAAFPLAGQRGQQPRRRSLLR